MLNIEHHLISYYYFMFNTSTTQMSFVLFVIGASLSVCCFCILLLILILRQRFAWKRSMNLKDGKAGEISVAFFHPYCASGGGGERVLWTAIQVLSEIVQSGLPIRVVIYTVDPPREGYTNDLLSHVQSRFSISIPTFLPLQIVHLRDTAVEEPHRPTSLVRQSINSIALSWKALNKFTPHVYFDTSGHAFTFPVARILAGCKVATYVHYPTISTDMLSLVWERRPTYNNNSTITSSTFATYFKLLYYSVFAICYGIAGSMSNLVMVNSSWTLNHIQQLWRFSRNKRIHVVFPPCDTSNFEDLPILEPRENIIISVGQFRPEKDHALQLRSFSLFKNKYLSDPTMTTTTQGTDHVQLILLGSCRDLEDQARVEELRRLAVELNVSDSVQFVLNQPFPVLKQWLGRASVGLHTMWNEHFGIGVVEMMSAGCITIAHCSGGPRSDIILRNGSTGFLATTEEEYASIMADIFVLGRGEDTADAALRIQGIRKSGRESAKRFSVQNFKDSFKKSILFSNILITS